MSERGEWRGIYTVLSDTPEFQDLGPEPQLLWFHLKLRLGAAGIDTLPAAEYVLADATGIPSEGVRDGIERLSEGGWLARERNVFWLRNALKFEPSRNLGNRNHLKSIRNHLLGLPKLAIVNDFAETYELDPPFPELIPSEGYPDGTPDNGRRKTEDGRRSSNDEEPSSLRSEEPSSTAAVVGEFLERTGSKWRLDASISEWCSEIKAEPKYAGADIDYEIRKCADWHVGEKRTPKHPDISIRNWLEKAASRAKEKSAADARRRRSAVPASQDRLTQNW